MYRLARLACLVGLLLFCLDGFAADHIHTLASVKPTAKTEKRDIEVAGLKREYRFYRPANLPASTQAPLVLMLHGRHDTDLYAEHAYHWDQTADAHGFIVAYPQGYKHAWNAGHCCGKGVKENINEVQFLDALILELIKTENIDPERVYLAGMSNGALMGYRMACEGTVPLAGIGSVSGDLVFECPAPVPNSIIEIHGSDDKLLPLHGRDEPWDKGFIPSTTKSLDVWRKIDNCQKPVTKRSPDGVTDSLADCAHGREIELMVLMGAGHQWPGGLRHLPLFENALFRIAQPDDRLDATAKLWTFFEPLRAHASTPKANPEPIVFANPSPAGNQEQIPAAKPDR